MALLAHNFLNNSPSHDILTLKNLLNMQNIMLLVVQYENSSPHSIIIHCEAHIRQ